MGSEMSCPCTERPPLEGELSDDEKAVHDLMSKRFNKEDIVFTSEIESTKICIIESEKVEAFLKNKNNLRYKIKKEVYNILTQLSVLYNNINLTNCINNNNLVLIILEYMYDGKKNLDDSNEDKYVFKGKRIGLSDTILNYKVINFSLVTSEPSRIIDLIKMNVNNMLKSDYLFTGVVNSSKEKSKEYKLIFKKILKYTSTITYHIINHEGILSHPILDKIIKDNNHMVVRSVLIYNKSKGNTSNKKSYFFIFEKCESENKVYDNLVVEMRRKQMPDNIYYADLAMKLSNLNKDIYNYKLTCLINDEDSIFFILNEESDAFETPDTNI